jgi:CBS domain-containing protein
LSNLPGASREVRTAAYGRPTEQARHHLAGQLDVPVTRERSPRTNTRRDTLPTRDLIAGATAVLFAVLGFAAIYVVAKVADVKDGAVLAVVLIVPALLYLMLSGRVNELKAPGGLEVRLSEAANRTIPVHGKDTPASALAYEELRAVETGRRESFLRRIRDITPADPVILTVTLGSGPIDGGAVANYAKGMTQFPRFRFVAIVDSSGHLISYMEERAFRHLIEADVIDAQELLNNIEHQNVGEIRKSAGMIIETATPDTSIADTLRQMESLRLNALLVTENGRIRGIVERERLTNALLLSLRPRRD